MKNAQAWNRFPGCYLHSTLVCLNVHMQMSGWPELEQKVAISAPIITLDFSVDIASITVAVPLLALDAPNLL